MDLTSTSTSSDVMIIIGLTFLALGATALVMISALMGKMRMGQQRIKRLEAEYEAELARGREREVALATAATRLEAFRTLKLDYDELRREHALASDRLARQEATAAAREEALNDARRKLLADFQALAGEALKATNESFLTLANETFEKHKASLATEGLRHETEIKGLMAPIGEQLKVYQERLKEIETARGSDTLSLQRQISGLQSETARLVNALRAAPKTRGRWGEEALKNVLELSGMSPFCDFVAEKSFATEEGRLRPDVIVRMPGGRFLIIDAKAPISAYFEAVDSVDEDERERHLLRHALQVRDHMKKLAAKQYQDHVREGLNVTADFVVMFVPGDNFFSAAIERDPQLFQDGSDMNVLIVTPTTLLALAKAIAFGWRQEKVAENARHVADLGRDLYKRLATMGEHVAGLGKALERGVRSYNDFVGSLEGSVMPQARRFVELEVVKESLGELPPVRAELREARQDRDLRFAPTLDLALPPAHGAPAPRSGTEDA